MAFGPFETLPNAGLIRLLAAVGVAVIGVLAIVLWLAFSAPKAPPSVVVALPRLAAPAPAPAAEAVAPEAAAAVVEPQVVGPHLPPPGFRPGGGLPPAPDPDLIEKGGSGFVPTIGRDGREPWEVYARPFDLADKRPRVAIIISNLASSATETDAAIHGLPPAVTLSFMPYRRRLGEWIALARAAGHEVMLDLPMEPPDALHNDPGPNALRIALDAPANITRLEWMMSQAAGYVGMVGYMGGRFAADRDDMQPILQDIRKRGLVYVDNRATPESAAPALAADMQMPFAEANRLLDTDPSRAAVDRKLTELEEIAKRGGIAVGIGQPIQIVLERVGAWAQTLNERGIVLAPVSAVASIKPQPPEPKAAEPAAKPDPAAAPKAGAAPPPVAPTAPAKPEAAPPAPAKKS